MRGRRDGQEPARGPDQARDGPQRVLQVVQHRADSSARTLYGECRGFLEWLNGDPPASVERLAFSGAQQDVGHFSSLGDPEDAVDDMYDMLAPLRKKNDVSDFPGHLIG